MPGGRYLFIITSRVLYFKYFFMLKQLGKRNVKQPILKYLNILRHFFSNQITLLLKIATFSQGIFPSKIDTKTDEIKLPFIIYILYLYGVFSGKCHSPIT